MATYKVIQDIEAEDKLVGPLTLRQFVYAGIAAVSGYLGFLMATKGAPFMLAVVHSAFLADPQQRALAAGRDGRADTARGDAGPAGDPGSRLTESLTGAYRNRLHQLMLRYGALAGLRLGSQRLRPRCSRGKGIRRTEAR